VYIPGNSSEPVARLDDALIKAVAAEPALRKLRTAVRNGTLPPGDPEVHVDAGLAAGIVTEPEAAGIRAAISARKAVIQVDEFPPEYFTTGKESSAWENSKPEDGVAGGSL
jgi:acyl-CoA dehydrogenase